MRIKIRKTLIVLLSVFLLGFSLIGCASTSNSGANSSGTTGTQSQSSNLSGSISISGSSALYPLANNAATAFKKDNPDVSITVGGGGSGTGLNNVLAGTVDIGNSDVYATEKLAAAEAGKLVDHKVCLIGVAVIVNSDIAAKVNDLSTAQLTAIFSGKTTNWQDVGGPDEQITIVNRPSSSGTRALFVKWALGGQSDVEGDSSLQTDDSNALLATVGNTSGAIGYIAFSYLVNAGPGVAKVRIDGVDANYDNIYSNKYQIWGYEHMYTAGQPNAQTQAFLDYMTSKTMSTQAEIMGYGTISKLNAAAAASR
ncbi:MAG: phosphate ABC transporter substrate-binding protein [Actinomycetia bacterium]|nr:phosphate ABC transporter substrate-binding protein [Actinomycetes bacterium]